MGAALSELEHVVCLRLGGEDAFDAMDVLCPADLYVRDGQILHTLLLTDDGLPLADVYACCDDEGFLLLCEGPTAAQLVAHVHAHLPDGVEPAVEDLSASHRVLSLNGPYAWEVLAGVVGPEVVGLPYLSFYHEQDFSVLRAGKTGEFGYDLLVPVEQVDGLRARLEAEASGLDLVLAPADLDTLDQCALENWFFNIRREGSAGVSPLDLQLQWRLSPHKDDHVGARAVQARREAGPLHRLTCVEWADRTLEPGAAVSLGEHEVGRLVNVGQCPLDGGWVGLALLEEAVAHPGCQGLVAGEVPLRAVSPPVINNRSLFIDPQQHSARTRREDRFPPLRRRHGGRP